MHVCLCEEVVHAVQKHVQGGRSAGEERGPPPPPIFVVDQEIRRHDGHAHGHYRQDDVDQQHEAVHVVEFVIPERREYEPHFDKNAAKGQQPRHEHEEKPTAIPRRFRDGPRERIDATRPIRFPAPLPAQDGPAERQRQRHKEPDDEHGKECAHGQGVGPVRDSDRVQAHNDRRDDRGHRRPREQEDLDPVRGGVGVKMALVKRTTVIASHERGEAPTGDEAGGNGAPLRVQCLHNGQGNHDEHHEHELVPCPEERREQHDVVGLAKNISVYLLPTRIFTDAALSRIQVVLVPHVLGVVITQRAEQNQGHEAN